MGSSGTFGRPSSGGASEPPAAPRHRAKGFPVDSGLTVPDPKHRLVHVETLVLAKGGVQFGPSVL